MSDKSEPTTSSQSQSWSEDSRAKTSAKPESEPVLTESEAASGQSLPASFARYDPESSSWKTSQRCLLKGWAEWSEKWPRAGMIVCGIAYQLKPSAPIIGGTVSLSSEPCENDHLEEVVAEREYERVWPTPTVTMYNLNETPESFLKRQAKWAGIYHNSIPLTVAVKIWPTPTARDWKDTGDLKKLATHVHKKKLACSVAASDTSLSGSLNPTWVEWLMGFEIGFTDCDASETP